MKDNYIPQKQDIIWIDFDPSLGKEIQKRRPALVVSS
ncbi:type II toxin-antitoxin system PemK/MazF family toxin, partial [Streptococcus suis]